MPFFDGVAGPVYYRHWAAEVPTVNLVFLHGYGEHSGLYHRLADSLSADGVDVWALDHLGHGLTSGQRGNFGSLRQLCENASTLTAVAHAAAPELPVVIAGHSLGSVAATLTALDSPSSYAGLMISGAPLSPVPWIDPEAEQFDLDPSELSTDPFYLDALVNDSLAFVSSDFGELLARELRRAWSRFDADLSSLRLPILAVHGDLDRISPVDGVRRWLGEVPGLELREVKGARHDVLNESSHRRTAALIADFVLERAQIHDVEMFEEDRSWHG